MLEERYRRWNSSKCVGTSSPELLGEEANPINLTPHFEELRWVFSGQSAPAHGRGRQGAVVWGMAFLRAASIPATMRQPSLLTLLTQDGYCISAVDKLMPIRLSDSTRPASGRHRRNGYSLRRRILFRCGGYPLPLQRCVNRRLSRSLECLRTLFCNS